MKRFFAPPEIAARDEFDLPEMEGHHAVRVLRCRVGEPVQVLDGAGSMLVCEVVNATRSTLGVRVSTRNSEPRPMRELVLAQAILKGKAMDLVVEKATELGATRIIPLISDHSVAIPDGVKQDGKVEKWRNTALAAIKQCGRTWLPRIEPPNSMDKILAEPDRVYELVASLQGAVEPLTEIATELPPGRPVRVWIGPEGDFSEVEYGQLRQAGAQSVSLSDAVLRSETAAICALSCLQSPHMRR